MYQMFERESDFFELSKEIAADFLQSVVIIDDNAYFGEKKADDQEEAEDQEEHKEEKGLPPKRGSASQVDLQGETTTPDEQKDVLGYENTRQRLNATKVIGSFAQKGIVCSVLRPKQEDWESLTDTLHNLANCADIMVIDWSLHGDEGEKALEMLERLADSSARASQLRLIVIYSGIFEVADIPPQVKEVLEKAAKMDVLTEDDGFTLIYGPTRIAIFAKPDAFVAQEYQARKVRFEELADRVIEEFTVMTAGLVSNVVLKSLAQVRRNTAKILSQFSSDLDAPYLTHRALLLEPEDAEDLLTALMAEELQAILEEANVGRHANLNAIEAWLKSKDKTTFTLEGSPLTHQQITELLQHGLQEWTGLSRRKKRQAHKLPFSDMFQASEPRQPSLDEKFAFMTTMRSFYEKTVPTLTLGTILKQTSADEPAYWVCLQPRCDCIRIEDERAFPFLPLRVKNKGQKFDVILWENGDYLRLLCSKKPYDQNLIPFVPDPQATGVITAKETDGVYYFHDTKQNQYEWMGELRIEHALRLANDLATILSRVGLDESEWLRLWATRG